MAHHQKSETGHRRRRGAHSCSRPGAKIHTGLRLPLRRHHGKATGNRRRTRRRRLHFFRTSLLEAFWRLGEAQPCVFLFITTQPHTVCLAISIGSSFAFDRRGPTLRSFRFAQLPIVFRTPCRPYPRKPRRSVWPTLSPVSIKV